MSRADLVLAWMYPALFASILALVVLGRGAALLTLGAFVAHLVWVQWRTRK